MKAQSTCLDVGIGWSGVGVSYRYEMALARYLGTLVGYLLGLLYFVDVVQILRRCSGCNYIHFILGHGLCNVPRNDFFVAAVLLFSWLIDGGGGRGWCIGRIWGRYVGRR